LLPTLRVERELKLLRDMMAFLTLEPLSLVVLAGIA